MSNETNETAKQSVTDCNHLGNAAKMHEACANIAEYAKAAACHTNNSRLLGYLSQIERWAESALAAPPRNIDVITMEEQYARFYSFCDKYEECKECPLWRGGGIVTKCYARWASMPYEEGGTE